MQPSLSVATTQPTVTEPVITPPAADIEQQQLQQPLLEPSKTEHDANSSVGASIANMTNNVLGSGLVALAYAVSRVGTNLWLHRSARSSLASSF